MKKTFVSILLMLLVLPVFSSQRLTFHRTYSGFGNGSGKILYLKSESENNTDIWSMNSDGSSPVRLTSDALVEVLADIFPDKSKLAIVKRDETNDYIYIVNSDGSGGHSIYSTVNIIYSIRISPDGSKIAFIEGDTGDTNRGTIYVINSDGSNVRTLKTSGPEKLYSGVLIQKNYLFDVGGTTVTKGNTSVDDMVDFLSDSSGVVFIDYTDFRMAKINTDGTGFVKISTFTVNEFRCLENGKILLIRSIYPQYQIARINSDGTGYETLYSTSVSISSLSISPDGMKYLFTSRNFIGPATYIIIFQNGTLFREIPGPEDVLALGSGWVNDSIILCNSLSDIYVMDVTDPDWIKLTDGDSMEFPVDAKNDRVVFLEGKKIFVVKTDGTEKILLGEYQIDEMSLLFAWAFGATLARLSPDGSRVAISGPLSSSSMAKLVVKDTNGGNEYLITESTNSFNSISWNASGTKILYEHESKFYVVNPDGTGNKQILDSTDSGDNFMFSPDGTRVVFNGALLVYGNQPGIYSASLDVTSFTFVYPTSYELAGYKSNKFLLNSYNDMYVVNDDGTNLVNLDTGSGYIMDNSAEYVAYQYSDYSSLDRYDLFIIRTDSTSKTKITDYNATYIGQPAYLWLDSGKLAYKIYLRPDGFSRIFIFDPDTLETRAITPSGDISIAGVISGSVVSIENGDIWVRGVDDPILQVSPDFLDFGEVKHKDKKTLTFTITNEGKGTLSGRITSDAGWIVVSPGEFQQNELQVSVTVDNNILEKKTGQYSGKVMIWSNGGYAEVSIRVTATCVLTKPNPFIPENGNLVFFGSGIIPFKTEIKIYSLSGELVKKLSTTDPIANEIFWDGKDMDNKIVVSGIYIYTYSSSVEKGTGKITVIRK